jgi:prophage DNA circulation protein
MAWIDTLLDATFRGVTFDCVGASDAVQRALVEHDYPYVAGADVEDMGAHARKISLRAVFYGADYETRMQVFIAALDGLNSDSIPDAASPLGGWLQHPVFGMMFCQVASYRVAHEAETVDEAQLEIEFVESTPAAPFFGRELAVQKAEAITQHAQSATAAATENLGSTVERTRNPLAVLDGLRSALMGPLLGVTRAAGVLLSGLDVLAYPRAWGNDISALVNGILDLRQFGSNLLADWANIQNDLNAFAIFSRPPGALPYSPAEAAGIAAVAATVQVNTAAGLANAAGLVLAAEATTPTLTPTQIEAVAATARAAIEAAIIQVRAVYGIEKGRAITEPLKDQALAVQEAARAIIVTRPPLIRRTVEADGNFRLLAHLWYSDHSRAPELYRLNGARSPFVRQGEVVNAYAK